ncbi:hypothetical protein [Pseudidiomarina indica]|nr:hypothetical protein [Pseudidiomarina indica]
MKPRVFIYALLSGILLTSCKPAPLPYENSSPGKIRHIFDPDQPKVEQPMTVIFTVAPDIELQRGVIEGVSMYMGTIPLVVEPVSETQWQAELWLGACSDPQMRWRATIPWVNPTAGTRGQYQFEFVTETN